MRMQAMRAGRYARKFQRGSRMGGMPRWRGSLQVRAWASGRKRARKFVKRTKPSYFSSR